jgi:hypothetical protein
MARVHGGGIVVGALCAVFLTANFALVGASLAIDEFISVEQASLMVVFFNVLAPFLGFVGAVMALFFAFKLAPQTWVDSRPGLVGALAGLGHTVLAVVLVRAWELFGSTSYLLWADGLGALLGWLFGALLVAVFILEETGTGLVVVALSATLAGFLSGRIYGWVATD